jgi:hypothetical protein
MIQYNAIFKAFFQNNLGTQQLVFIIIIYAAHILVAASIWAPAGDC